MAATVTIGLPVYNESRFLRESIDAILSQSFTDFDLVICDNASTDNTGEIALEYSSRDPRIRYFRNEENIGAAGNFNKSLELACGEYFMWASGHDLWSPGFVEHAVKLLRENPEAIVAAPTTLWIDECGATIARRSGHYDTRGMTASGRFFTILWGNMHPILGVFRTEALRTCTPFHEGAGTDLVVLSKLGLVGDFVASCQSVLYRRDFRHEASYKEKLKRYASKEYGLSRKGLSKIFPLFTLPLKLLSTVVHSNQPLVVRILISIALLGSLPLRYFDGRRQ